MCFTKLILCRVAFELIFSSYIQFILLLFSLPAALLVTFSSAICIFCCFWILNLPLFQSILCKPSPFFVLTKVIRLIVPQEQKPRCPKLMWTRSKLKAKHVPFVFEGWRCIGGQINTEQLRCTKTTIWMLIPIYWFTFQQPEKSRPIKWIQVQIKLCHPSP